MATAEQLIETEHEHVEDLPVGFYSVGPLGEERYPVLTYLLRTDYGKALYLVNRYGALEDKIAELRGGRLYLTERYATAGRPFGIWGPSHRIGYSAELLFTQSPEYAANCRTSGPKPLTGRRAGKCRICHRPLTDPESISKGIGPDCEAKIREQTERVLAANGDLSAAASVI